MIVYSFPLASDAHRSLLLELVEGDRTVYRAASLMALSRLPPGEGGIGSDLAKEYLGDADAEVRASAQSILRRNRDMQLAGILELVDSPHEDVRSFALQASRFLPQAEGRQVVEELLLDESVAVRAAVIREYARRRLDGALDILGFSLQDDNGEIQQAAVMGLMNLGTEQAQERLAEAVRSVADPRARQLAASYLANLARRQRVPPRAVPEAGTTGTDEPRKPPSAGDRSPK
jgi:HEAT repeat protein